MTALFLLSACGGGSTSQVSSAPSPIPEPSTPSENLAIPDNRNKTSYQILIIGNSHVSGIQSLLTTIFENNNEAKNVTIETRNGTFLDTIVNNENIIDLIFVIIQDLFLNKMEIPTLNAIRTGKAHVFKHMEFIVNEN